MRTGTLTRRTPAQREHVIEARLRAIESGEYMEKAGLADLVGPPIRGNFRVGESIHALKERAESHQDLVNRAARAGLYLPGQRSGAVDEIVRLKKLERDSGVVAQAMPVKDRFGIALGLAMKESSWEIPDCIEYDYAYLNLAGATTFNGGILGVMPATNAQKIGSPDPIGASLTVASTSRVVGSGAQPYFSVLSCWAFLRSSAGAVYVATAGTTLQLFVCSAAQAASQLYTNLTAAFGVNGATQFWTQLAITSPADRTIAIGSVTDPQTGICFGFYGDYLFGQLITTGALNVQGNSMIMELELA